jgi:predicted NUDIX family NTP pyrophosphohydrolase
MSKSSKQSAGILVYRYINEQFQVFLVHPGGPFWAKKDLGSWSVPKGEFTNEESGIEAAKREFYEETSISISWDEGQFIPLQPVKQKSGKTIYAWAYAFDFGEQKIRSNTFQLEWPPKSGKMIEVPEVDQGEWFELPEVEKKINPAQLAFIEELVRSI